MHKHPEPNSGKSLSYASGDVDSEPAWLKLLMDAYSVIDRGVSIAIGREKRKRKKGPACRERCDACCRNNTDIPVYPLELAGIAWYAAEKIKEPLRSILKGQLQSYDCGPPCPFLIGKECSIYPVRPAACRQYIVFGRPCSDNEDPYYSRREDVLTPLSSFMDEAVYIMLPFYGISRDSEKKKAVMNRFIHTKVQNIFSCNWKSLIAQMDMLDSAPSKVADESKGI